VEFAVISDTHWREPNPELERLLHRLVGAKYILHAGDVVSPAILDALAQVAPVLAVIGNCCGAGLRGRLPVSRVDDLDGLKVGMTHGHLYDLRDGQALLEQFVPEVKLVIHGHTHLPRLEIHEDRWLFNPGSVSEPRHGTPACYGWGSWQNGELKLEHKRF
jgi:putative phosphoesterase